LLEHARKLSGEIDAYANRVLHYGVLPGDVPAHYAAMPTSADETEGSVAQREGPAASSSSSSSSSVVYGDLSSVVPVALDYGEIPTRTLDDLRRLPAKLTQSISETVSTFENLPLDKRLESLGVLKREVGSYIGQVKEYQGKFFQRRAASKTRDELIRLLNHVVLPLEQLESRAEPNTQTAQMLAKLGSKKQKSDAKGSFKVIERVAKKHTELGGVRQYAKGLKTKVINNIGKPGVALSSAGEEASRDYKEKYAEEIGRKPQDEKIAAKTKGAKDKLPRP